jgi:hypothetical protein
MLHPQVGCGKLLFLDLPALTLQMEDRGSNQDYQLNGNTLIFPSNIGDSLIRSTFHSGILPSEPNKATTYIILKITILLVAYEHFIAISQLASTQPYQIGKKG